jgi:hypothetical protein
MPISYAELKAKLDVDEPDYAALAERAAGAMQHLRRLAASADVSLASKAVSLAGIIGDADSIGIVGSASKSREVLVRVAAAHAATMLPDGPQSARVVGKLLDDKDVGVLKLATRAAARMSDPGVASKAKRARARMVSAVRATTAQRSRRERSMAMATKAGKKGAGATRAKAGRTRAGGQMPSGKMTEPPRGAKARDMPTGKMR